MDIESFLIFTTAGSTAVFGSYDDDVQLLEAEFVIDGISLVVCLRILFSMHLHTHCLTNPGALSE